MDSAAPWPLKVYGDQAEELGLPEKIVEHLKGLDFVALQLCACCLLSAVGYHRVRMLGRVRFLGNNASIGADIEAFADAGIGKERVLVRVRRSADPTSKRSVDEIRGAALREEARQAVLISLSPFSPLARSAARKVPAVPVWLIDGTLFATMLIRHRLGVREESITALRLDTAFFERLTSEAALPLDDL